MPICPKCGKCFSSEQALQYHMNKKYPCGMWKCANCNEMCDTKFALKIHNMACSNYNNKNIPSFDILSKLYSQSSIMCFEVDDNGVIHSVSPSVEKHLGYNYKDLIGKRYDSISDMDTDTTVFHKSKFGTYVSFRKEKIDNLLIEYIIC